MTFENFWSQYPKKVGKLTAKRSWEKLSLDNQQKALEAIVEHRKYWVAKGTDWEFIPHASTWLNQERFEDSVYASQTRRLDPQFQRLERSQDARLAAQGLGANSEATRNLRADFARDRADAYGEASNQAIQAGGAEQSRAIQQAIAGGTFGNQARTQDTVPVAQAARQVYSIRLDI